MLLQFLFTLTLANASELGTSRPLRTIPSAPSVAKPTAPPDGDENPVEACLRNQKIPAGSPRTVHGRDKEMCNKAKKLSFTTELDYRLTKTRSGIEILKTIEYVYQGKPENRAKVEARLENLKRCIPAFFKRYGLNLKLNFSSWSSATLTSIDISDSIKRADDSHWGLLSANGINQTPVLNCQTSAHEVGHMLGLEDHYVDKECPDHQLGPRDDIMRDPWSTSGRLYPSQIKKIIAPLCGIGAENK